MIMEKLHGGCKGKISMVLTALCVGGSLGGMLSQPVLASVPEAFSRGFSEIVARVQPAVVSVVASGGSSPRGPRRLPPGPFGGPPGPPMPPPGMPRPFGPPGGGAGSGVIISPEGHIVTNNHVVEDGPTLMVTTFDGKEFPATIIGTDPKTDLAVIKIEGHDLPFIEWSLGEESRVGDIVLAIGSPFGLKSSVTMGIISAVGRDDVGITEYGNFIQTDAPINPGNSGGPLVNMAGEIVGINTAIFSRTGGSEGVGFAIPVGIAKDITNSLITTGRVVRGWMGIAIQELTPALAQSFQLPESYTSGVLISEVNAKGPSAGNLQRGDVLLEYRGEKIRDINHLRHIVARTMVGTGVDVTILRDGLVQTLTVTVGERPTDAMLALGGQASPPSAMGNIDNVLTGLNVGPLRREDRTRLNLSDEMTGVIIREVETGSEAEAAGLQQDDVIQEVDRKMVSSMADYRQIASQIAKEELVVLFINRRGNNLFIAVNPQ